MYRQLTNSIHLTCPICGSVAEHTAVTFKEKMFGLAGEFTYMDCSHCKALSKINCNEDLSPFYPKDSYYSIVPDSFLKSSFKKFRDYLYLIDTPALNLLKVLYPNTALQYALKATARNKKLAVLDVGCGNGFLLRTLARLGYTNLTGVDPLLSADTISDGIQLKSGNLSSITGVFDVIMFHHSLEHIADAGLVLSQAAGLLAPTGKILVRVPTRDSLAYLMYQENWFQIDAPRHLCLHSHASIKVMANNANLQISSIECDSQSSQFWISDMYKDGLTMYSKLKYFYKFKNYFFYKKLTHILNSKLFGDQLVVELVKNHP